jgi:ABC-type nitrate/sulfonate/bicarbonate transport system permease component
VRRPVVAARPPTAPAASDPARPKPLPDRAAGRDAHERWRTLAPPASVLVAVVTGWQLLTTFAHIDPTVLPGPRLVATATWDDRAHLWPALATTTEEVLGGLALAILVAFVAGIAIDRSRTVRGSVYPLIVASQTVPIIALAPLVLIWFGFGTYPKVVLVGLFSFFPITVGLVGGLASVDAEAINLVRTMRASGVQILTRVRLPAALPQMFTGLRISVTYAYTSAIVAEFVGATQGLAVYMNAARTDAPIQTDLVFGATLVTAVATIVLFCIVGLVERMVMPWRPPRSR